MTDWEDEEIWAPLEGEWEGGLPMTQEMHELIHGEEGVLDLVWAFVDGAIGIEPVITRIAQAIENGMPLPNEVGRNRSTDEYFEAWIAAMLEGGARTLIAFRLPAEIPQARLPYGWQDERR